MLPAALLLDLDGTLVDSEPRHILAHQRFLATVGITIEPAVATANIGKGDRSFYTGLMAAHGVAGDAQDWVRRKTDLLMGLYRSEGLPLRAGVSGLLQRAFRAGIPCPVVTSAERRLCALSLEVTGLAERLPARVCHEDVVHHKPDPEPYLLAARRLAVPPERCWVIEDSVSGVRAGLSAGCRVFGFAGCVPATDLRAAGAQLVVETLDDVHW